MSDDANDSLITTIRSKPGLFIPAAGLTVFMTVLGGVERACSFYEKKQQEAVAEKLWREEVSGRLDSLERWKCVLGWSPPDSKNRDRVCDQNETE